MTMSITVVDLTKLKDSAKTCLFEGQIVAHGEKRFHHVCKYDDGTIDMIPLIQYKRKTPNIERYRELDGRLMRSIWSTIRPGPWITNRCSPEG